MFGFSDYRHRSVDFLALIEHAGASHGRENTVSVGNDAGCERADGEFEIASECALVFEAVALREFFARLGGAPSFGLPHSPGERVGLQSIMALTSPTRSRDWIAAKK